MKRQHLALCIAILLAVSLLPAKYSSACEPIAPPGFTVNITDESAIIIWNPATHTEEFIRRAHFDTTAPNLGFLVPTPTLPSLSKADDTQFTDFEEKMKPETWEVPVPGIGSLIFGDLVDRPASEESPKPASGNAVSTGSPPGPPVEILNTQRVGNYIATVLKASDPLELKNWLKKHGYPVQPTTTAWLEPYVRQGWIITAFKVLPLENQQGNGLNLQAVKMTFTTPKPFYPYREPETSRKTISPRTLRIFFLSPEGRYAGRLGENGALWGEKNIPWLGTAPTVGVEWAGNTGTDLITGNGVTSDFLTVFLDKQSPRPGLDDLFFERANYPYVNVRLRPHLRFVHPHGFDFPIESIPITVVGAVLYRRRKRRQI